MLRFLINNSIEWLKDQQHHFLMHLYQTVISGSPSSTSPTGDSDSYRWLESRLSACRVGMGGWRWLLWTNSYWHWLGTLITQNEFKKKSASTRKENNNKTLPQKIRLDSAATRDRILTWKWISPAQMWPACVSLGFLSIKKYPSTWVERGRREWKRADGSALTISLWFG